MTRPPLSRGQALGVVRHEQFRHAAERRESAGMSADPVGQRLGPARLSIGEVGGAQDGHENLRRTDLAGEPVDDHRHRVAGVIDKQLVAADMGSIVGTRGPRAVSRLMRSCSKVAGQAKS